MKSAKFHLIGEDSDWYKIRVQKEIEAHGLSGSVIDAGEGKLVVVIEGDGERINGMYESLKEASPTNVVFTLIEYGMKKEAGTKKEEDKLSEIMTLLKEIEKNTRKINQKLNSLPEKTIEKAGEEESPAREEESHEAEKAFAFMFG